jgi:HD superfamily phosphohydrolase
MSQTNKKKIINDPIYGFISIPNAFFYELIEHAAFQRLRRILQLGLTHLVYPGALHTRFHHALGAMHLMQKALEVLRRKGVTISEEEEQAVLAAILLHDIGHGPYSHTLEHTLIKGVSHEDISVQIMNYLQTEFGDLISGAMRIFNNHYNRPFLHQLVSGQLDMDRMDYLNRDSFYTGVYEGRIGSERIIEMLNVHKDNLVVEYKGIYSVEKFITSRRLMYWQAYMHKTVVAAEYMLIKTLERAMLLYRSGERLFASPALRFFLENQISKRDFNGNPEVLRNFLMLDDYDIMGAIKVWTHHEDRVLSLLSRGIIQRKLLKIQFLQEPLSPERRSIEIELAANLLKLGHEEAQWFVIDDKLTNKAYDTERDQIQILMPGGEETIPLPIASDNLNISTLSKPVTKYVLCYPSANLIL